MILNLQCLTSTAIWDAAVVVPPGGDREMEDGTVRESEDGTTREEE